MGRGGGLRRPAPLRRCETIPAPRLGAIFFAKARRDASRPGALRRASHVPARGNPAGATSAPSRARARVTHALSSRSQPVPTLTPLLNLWDNIAGRRRRGRVPRLRPRRPKSSSSGDLPGPGIIRRTPRPGGPAGQGNGRSTASTASTRRKCTATPCARTAARRSSGTRSRDGDDVAGVVSQRPLRHRLRRRRSGARGDGSPGDGQEAPERERRGVGRRRGRGHRRRRSDGKRDGEEGIFRPPHGGVRGAKLPKLTPAAAPVSPSTFVGIIIDGDPNGLLPRRARASSRRPLARAVLRSRVRRFVLGGHSRAREDAERRVLSPVRPHQDRPAGPRLGPARQAVGAARSGDDEQAVPAPSRTPARFSSATRSTCDTR